MSDLPQFVHVFSLTAIVGAPIEVSPSRRLIPITGGEALGPKVHGKILDGGTDFQLIRPDGVAELQARYVIQTNSGEMIYAENNAVRHGSPEAMEKLKCGEPVDPSEIYFRGAMRFETAAPGLAWLTRHIFIAAGRRFPKHVEIAVFQVL
jgi:hypothetical protein